MCEAKQTKQPIKRKRQLIKTKDKIARTIKNTIIFFTRLGQNDLLWGRKAALRFTIKQSTSRGSQLSYKN
jgi:hypothetical protein